MTLNPPVKYRSDKELFNIVSNERKWTQQARDEAYSELLVRNYTVNDITHRINYSRELIRNYESKIEKEREKNRTKSYHTWQILSILIFFPLTLLIPGNLFGPYWRLDKYNYKRRIRQRILLSILSVIIWIIIVQKIF
jgi:hypothetical protein